MCGIVGIFEIKEEVEELRIQLLKQAKTIRHRGPDWSGVFQSEKVLLAHERLSIVDVVSGGQPILSNDNALVLAINGEIYNHKQLKITGFDYDFKTQSDCEVILPLFRQYGKDLFQHLNGIYGFALYDIENDTYLIGRDHMGIIPLYYGRDAKQQLHVASELKALEGFCTEIHEFPPGHYLTSDDHSPVQWYKPAWKNYADVIQQPQPSSAIKEALEAAVHRQLMSDVPYGVLLSGGLDSSIISAITKKYAPKRVEADDEQTAWWPSLHSFAIGLKGAPDLTAAQKVADQIGTIHHEVNFTVQEGLDALSDVIYHLETYDITTIRASTPMYLLARVIKSMGIKMVLSGEGADEIFGGYLYFHKAPNEQAFHEETVRKLERLHNYDCLRANKSLAAWGIEGRVPFLDPEFLDVAMSIHPKDKMITSDRMEKWVLRDAFQEYIPAEIAWRQKEQFSDGVGYSWIDSIHVYANEKISDEEMANASGTFPINTPMTKEAYLYRTLFHSHFPSDTAAETVPFVPSIACSSPEALAWDQSFQNSADPSGRAIKNVHEKAYVD